MIFLQTITSKQILQTFEVLSERERFALYQFGRFLEVSKEKNESVLRETLKAIKEKSYFEIDSKKDLIDWLDKMDREIENNEL